MSDRLHATKVIARRRIFEALISPGFYVVLSVGLILAYFLVTVFPAVVDSSGINYALHPLYDQIARTVDGSLGAAFLGKLFSEGPFVLALYAAIFPIILFLTIHTIFRFTLERGVGAVELVDCRTKGWKPTIAEAVADNSLHAGLILGATMLPVSSLNLQTEGVILTQNGRLVSSACGIEALGNPLNVVTWLANKLAHFDHEIREGEIILTGSLTEYFFVSPGDFVEAVFSHLGSVDFAVA